MIHFPSKLYIALYICITRVYTVRFSSRFLVIFKIALDNICADITFRRPQNFRVHSKWPRRHLLPYPANPLDISRRNNLRTSSSLGVSLIVLSLLPLPFSLPLFAFPSLSISTVSCTWSLLPSARDSRGLPVCIKPSLCTLKTLEVRMQRRAIRCSHAALVSVKPRVMIFRVRQAGGEEIESPTYTLQFWLLPFPSPSSLYNLARTHAHTGRKLTLITSYIMNGVNTA